MNESLQLKIRRRILPKAKLIFLFSVAFAFFLFITKVVFWVGAYSKDTGITTALLYNILFDKGSYLKKEGERINVLVLGISGKEHAGSDLTDTMIILSISEKDKDLAMLSLPRDLWSDTLQDKINSAYHYGEEKKEGGGITLARAIIEDVVGFPIYYIIVVDFDGFMDIIDLVGGITIDVSQGFVDEKFPIPGKEEDLCNGDLKYMCRYKVVRFDKGIQRMSGEQALTYVRSRKAEGDEGSDFARSHRQQDMLLSIKRELVKAKAWFPLKKGISLLRVIKQSAYSNMKIGELLILGKIIARIHEDNVYKISLEPLLINPPLWMYNRYVLVPKDGEESIRAYLQKELYQSSGSATRKSTVPDQ